MTDRTLSPWRLTVRRRVVVAAACLAVWAAAIEARLVQFQIVQHDQLQARADRQSTRKVRVPPKRGEILDRLGRVLARSVDADAIYAVPTSIDDPAGTARAVCAALRDCTGQEREKIAAALADGKKRRREFSWIRRAYRLSPDAARRVEALGLPGIGFMKEPRRFYPNEELGAHVLGFVGVDNEGRAGVEAAFDRTIRGKPGNVFIQVDALGHPFSSISEPPTPGESLQLTIDPFLQFVAESELQAAVREHNAAGGSVVIMEPATGEILALANAPTFNPNARGQSEAIALRNRGIQDVYEPGSTFKMVTASAAIQERVMTPDDPIDVSAGSIRIGSRKPISDTHRYGVLSFTDVIVKSSNVGAVKVGLQLGAERLGRYVKAFGFGTRLSPDFPGENAGLLMDPAAWSNSALASVSMGYQIGVTPLQMAATASCIANGGELIKPRIVKARIAADGRRIEEHPCVVRRAIERDTAEQMTRIMEDVVERGTATAAKIAGYSIAGKTGTSNKIDPNGHYSKKDYNASFVGFIPSRKPALTILVHIDSPHGHGYYGGAVSAPVFKRIAEKAMQYLGIPPNVAGESPVLVASRDGKPSIRTAAPAKATLPLVVPALATQPGGVPDVVGLSAREAIRVLTRVGMTPHVSGDGVVLHQEPPAGSPIGRGRACTLSLGRIASPAPPVGDQRQ